jgi:hypothetical protein
MIERNERLAFSMDDGNPFRRLREVCGFTGANGPHFPGSSAYPVCFARTRADSLSAYREPPRAALRQDSPGLVMNSGKHVLSGQWLIPSHQLAGRGTNDNN